LPHLLPNIFLFVVTYAAGLLAMRVRLIDDKKMHLLLAFSGSFLLSITFLHLIPETIEDQGHKAGLYILIGFFLQLFIQRFTHGVEHGHSHSQGPQPPHTIGTSIMARIGRACPYGGLSARF
jgi:zinc and cadmium transporter